MNLVSRISLVLALVMCSACTTAPVSENYYLLGSSATTLTKAVNDSTAMISVNTVTLADYLNQRRLVMQLGDHQIQKAHYHLWAEDLAEAITRELLFELESTGQAANTQFQWSNTLTKRGNSLQLSVHFTQFHPSDRSEVLVAGYYQLLDKHSNRTLTAADFSFNKPLSANGYTHAVSQLRGLLAQLSENIHASLSEVTVLNSTNNTAPQS